jgi:hypothetical protein
MQYPEMGLRIQRLLDVKPPCYLAGPSGPAFFLRIFHKIPGLNRNIDEIARIP